VTFVTVVTRGRNPFTTSCGMPPPFFAGRQEETTKFDSSLQSTIGKAPRNLAFVGDFGIGKTVLLLEFSKRAQLEECASIYFPCRRFEDQLSYYNSLLQAIRSSLSLPMREKFQHAIAEVGFQVLGSGVNLKLREAPPDSIWGLVSLLEGASTVSEKPLVLFVDDFHLLTSSDFDSTDPLRQAFTVLVGVKHLPVMMVIASDAKVFGKIDNAHEPIARFLEPAILNGLSEADVRNAVNNPLVPYNYSFADDAIRRVYELSEGRPYYVQLCAYYSFERTRSRIIESQTVEEAVRDVLKVLAIERYVRMYEGCSETEHAVLRLLAGGALPHGQTVRICNTLGFKASATKMAIKRLLEDKRHLSKTSNGKYHVREKLFAEYIMTRATGED